MENLTCQFCGYTGTLDDDTFQVDQYHTGFWCEICDGYSYFEQSLNRHKFTLILEDKAALVNAISNPKSFKFNKRLSPYRYPGGKTKIIEYLYSHLQEAKSKRIVSPFTGGASFELAMLDSSDTNVSELHLNDLDLGVYSFWWVVKHMPIALIERIRSTTPNHSDYFKAQTVINNDYNGVDMVDAAWVSLLVNRLAFSGISKANPLGGKSGSKDKLLSRWNSDELIRRIERIHSLSDRITITQLNAIELIEQAYWQNETTIFIDPPYVAKGKDLYHCYYTEDNHRELASLLDSLYYGCPGADIVVTYDNNEWLNNLYDFPEKHVLVREYSA
jgi:Site-specific DNA methylase